MDNIGIISKYKIIEKTESGFFIKADSSDENIFMPQYMAPIESEVGMELEAFVYLDNKGKKIASSELPSAVPGEFAYLEVVEVQEFGAFFDWGIDKDLLVPGNEQKIKVSLGEKYIVRICLEEGTKRVFGTTKLGKYIEESEIDLLISDKVKFQVANRTDLGFRVIINKKYIGMIYHNEIFESIVEGEFYSGVVKNVRIDGLVDLALQVQGIKNLDAATEKIIGLLRKRKGMVELHDKSSPDDIKRELGMSKKTFKNAIGMLYKKKRIIINKDSIELTKK